VIIKYFKEFEEGKPNKERRYFGDDYAGIKLDYAEYADYGLQIFDIEIGESEISTTPIPKTLNSFIEICLNAGVTLVWK